MANSEPHDPASDKQMLDAVTAVAVAYLSKNAVGVDDITRVLKSIRDGLAVGGQEKQTDHAPAAGQGALFPVEGSVTDDKIRCLKCGKWFQELKRHLQEKHDMDPASYRAEVGLAPSTPLVALSTSSKRRAASQKKERRAEVQLPVDDTAPPEIDASLSNDESSMNDSANSKGAPEEGGLGDLVGALYTMMDDTIVPSAEVAREFADLAHHENEEKDRKLGIMG